MFPNDPIETSLPLEVIGIGLLVSIAFYLFVFHRGLKEVDPWVRYAITVLRVLLCVFVWGLIAQPRTVTERTEEVTQETRIGIDTSLSMSLVDLRGDKVSAWSEDSKLGLLDDAIAHAEAAKIRLNLLMGLLGESRARLKKEIGETAKLLSLAQSKVNAFSQETGLERLSARSDDDLAAAALCLEKVEIKKPGATLERGAKLAAAAALSLRRIAVVHSSQKSQVIGAQESSRSELVSQWLKTSEPLLNDLSEKGDLRLSTFASDLSNLKRGEEVPVSKVGGEETRLYENLNRMVEGDGKEGRNISILITDGMDSEDVAEARFSASVRNQPLIVLPIGGIDRSPDVRIESVVHPAQVREDDLFVATAQVSLFNSEPSVVTVNLIDGETVRTSQEVRLKGDGTSHSVKLEWPATSSGEKHMRVEVESLSDEKTVHNNSKDVIFSVTDDKYRILVCDSFSRWETRYLQNLFRRDSSIKAISVIFEPRHTYPGKEPVPMPALPLTLEAWQDFDLVVLGDLDPQQLTPRHQELLIEYVNRGGGLMLLAGRNSMPSAFVGAPLEKLLPMHRVQPEDLRGTFVIAPDEEQGVSPMVEIADTNSRSIWQTIYTMAPCYRISSWAKAKDSAQTLLVATDDSSNKRYDFLAVQRYGGGSVAYAAAPCFYNLRFRYGDRYHVRFWGEFVRGMCVGDFGFDGGRVKTRLDSQIWGFGDEVQGRVKIKDREGVAVVGAEFSAVLKRDDEVVTRMNPVADAATKGDYFIRFPDLEPGEYRLSYEGGKVGELWDLDRQILPDPLGCRFWVQDGAVSKELQFPMSEPTFWAKVNELPLGATIHPQTLGLVLDAIDLKPAPVTTVRSHSIWDTWNILLSIIIIAGLEWLLRRTQGLC